MVIQYSSFSHTYNQLSFMYERFKDSSKNWALTQRTNRIPWNKKRVSRCQKMTKQGSASVSHGDTHSRSVPSCHQESQSRWGFFCKFYKFMYNCYQGLIACIDGIMTAHRKLLKDINRRKKSPSESLNQSTMNASTNSLQVLRWGGSSHRVRLHYGFKLLSAMFRWVELTLHSSAVKALCRSTSWSLIRPKPPLAPSG